jgi:hypothetical protein
MSFYNGATLLGTVPFVQSSALNQALARIIH